MAINEDTITNVAVVGGGRMGLPLACVFAGHGARVTVCDTNAELVETIRAGRCPYEEPGLAELLGQVCAAGRLTATTDTAQATAQAQTVVIIVPAHLTPEYDINYAILEAASREAGRGLKPGTLVTYETTVAVGGTRQHLIPILEYYSSLRAGADFFVAFSPERVKARGVLSLLSVTPKVVGGFDRSSCDKAAAFYARYLGAPVDDVETLEAAEFTKLAGMLYRDVNIALSNELAEFSERAGIRYDLVRQLANRDGEASLLEPGIGVGGHCTPVYPYFLTRASRRFGLVQRLAEAAREINDGQPKRHVQRLAREWRPLQGARVHILGLGFRPGVKVDTFSPAYALLEALSAQGAEATLEDPLYTEEEIEQAGFVPARVGDDFIEAVILNTAHSEFSAPDFGQWKRSGVEAVVDGRNLWNRETVQDAGILYLGVGKGVVPAPVFAAKKKEMEAVSWLR